MLGPGCLLLLCLTSFAITDGSDAPLGKYAHHVSIRLKGVHICSGSIINQRHILTSSSCIISASIGDLTVVAGTNSLKTGGDLYEIQKIITPDSSYDDIAILRTRNNINFRRGVQSVELDNHNQYGTNFPLTVIGWERPSMGQTQLNMMLQELPYRLYDPDLCRMKNNLFGRQFLCIIDPTRRNTCNMDHGGGIIADGYLLGIYLNRQSCVDGREPKAHTPVHEYMNWIGTNSDLRRIRDHIEAGNVARSCSGNHDVPHGTYKYHVSVRRHNEHICSGTIINHRFVMTSQLCVIRDSPKDLSIVVGTDSLTIPGVLYGVERIVSHPGDDDFISLLQTNSEIIFNSLVQPIKLTDVNYQVVGAPAIFTAFERSISGRLPKSKLQAFMWEISDLKECAKQYKDYFDQSSICTIDPCYENICNIDYGGAVVSNGVMIGMKFHPDSCTLNVPTVHHRIYHYLGWIRQNSDVNKITQLSALHKPLWTSNSAYPYHVSIRRQNQHICSGSIINQRTILTSNNCIFSDKAKDLSVIAGSNSLTRRGDVYRVQRIIPTYNYNYDIALLRTTKNINFNDNVQPIPITTDDRDLYDSARLILTGWVHDSDGLYRNDKLQHISYETYNHGLCKQVIPFLNEAYTCSINPSHERSCFMDSGGPIVVHGVQIGLNPFGVRCEDMNGPHLYLPLHNHSAWIQRNAAF